MIHWDRRAFIRNTALGAAALTFLPCCITKNMDDPNQKNGPRFRISLAEWSLHKALQGGQLDNLDFPKKATTFGIYAVEYVNAFFKEKARDSAYLAELNRRSGDLGVKQLLIMVDGEGGLAEVNEAARLKAVENHHKWIEAAKTLGCHSIRVNAFSETPDRTGMHTAAVQSLGSLATYAKPFGINVIVENHGGFSSDGQWLAGVMREIDMDNCGTLPDFGNFCIRRVDGAQWTKPCLEEYDRYKGIEEMLPFAKGVSAKSYDFDAEGNETKIDYKRMIDLVKASDYRGHIGVEYEGSRLSEDEGIIATKKLLERWLT
ncbi:MAG: sugar phosphate isomerase/epimerase [Bacteroidota bacterium]|nr:sugar phosphate isomerase/epimerase [Bacteroidota bacterium]